jgi:hypothetical protein
MLKKILLFLLIALIAIQFIHPEKNKIEGAQTNFIGNIFPLPEKVKVIMAKACNDCHTNNSTYPWYANIQPVHWWMNNHIMEGKKELNFDEYKNRSLRFQYHKMEEIAEQVKEGEMPLESYTWMHKDAKLSEDEKNELITWADGIRDSLKANYPMDSLVRKK